jgi:hypothetical protein
MNEPKVPFLIRIRASLKAKIEELAKGEHRSMNQQIEYLLEQALARPAAENKSLRRGRKTKPRTAGG